nr:hypothetical protein [Thermococcus argininiproducens]
MGKLKLSDRQLYALIEAIKLGEEVKPSQQAKRKAFAKYKINGWENSKLTGVFYFFLLKASPFGAGMREF